MIFFIFLVILELELEKFMVTDLHEVLGPGQLEINFQLLGTHPPCHCNGLIGPWGTWGGHMHGLMASG